MPHCLLGRLSQSHQLPNTKHQSQTPGCAPATAKGPKRIRKRVPKPGILPRAARTTASSRLYARPIAFCRHLEPRMSQGSGGRDGQPTETRPLDPDPYAIRCYRELPRFLFAFPPSPAYNRPGNFESGVLCETKTEDCAVCPILRSDRRTDVVGNATVDETTLEAARCSGTGHLKIGIGNGSNLRAVMNVHLMPVSREVHRDG